MSARWSPHETFTRDVLTKDDSAIQLKGCLEYGNRGDTIQSFFFGTKATQKEADAEAKETCRQAIVRSQDGEPSVLEKLILQIKNFLPSDASNPSATMLEIDGVVGVEDVTESAYTSTFFFQARRMPGSDGIPSDLTIKPSFRGATEPLLSAFRDKNTVAVRATEKSVISFRVNNVKNPKLAYAAYEFFDRRGKFVGSIEIPVFVSENK